MTRLVFRRGLRALEPVDDAACAWFNKTKHGELVMVERPRKPRNIGHHRKLFALLKLVVDNCDRYPDTETLLDALKIGTGHCKAYPATDGKTTYIKPLSIAFENMDQHEFEEWYDRVVDLICAKLLPGVGRADLIAQVNEIVDPLPAARRPTTEAVS